LQIDPGRFLLRSQAQRNIRRARLQFDALNRAFFTFSRAFDVMGKGKLMLGWVINSLDWDVDNSEWEAKRADKRELADAVSNDPSQP
jgi:hypothetical protein